MSNIYHAEPPTQGKVLIKTSYGDIDVELWAKETPLACRNFIQLALEGQYDNTVIHRIIKGFMAQMGDPTGTGDGGSSIWDKPFKDELHGRIRFNHRGQVAMANENKPNSNKSQFFITLDSCEWLDGKHTIFGKVTGSTIFNVLRLNDVEVDGNDRPLDPIRVIGIDVLWNPFDDIVPRDMSKLRPTQASTTAIDLKKSDRKAVKDNKLLSFGDDEEEEEVFIGRKHSSHDSKFKSKKFSSKAAVDIPESESRHHHRQQSHSTTHHQQHSQHQQSDNRTRDELDFEERLQSQIQAKQLQVQSKSSKSKQSVDSNEDDEVDDDDDENERDGTDSRALHNILLTDNDRARAGELKEKSREFNKLKAGLLRSRRAVNVLTGSDADALRQETAFKEMISPLEQRRAKYMKRKNEFGNRSEETLAKLQKFTQSLRTSKKENNGKSSNSSAPVVAESYHGQVMEKDSDDEGAGDDLKDWHHGKLKFRKHIDDKYRMSGGDGRKSDDYTYIDTRANN